MSPESQRIAIAEACGWRAIKKTPELDLMVGDPPLPITTHTRSGVIPSYLTDLNAMHEAEKVLTLGQREAYADCLDRIGILTDEMTIDWDDVFLVAHATAAQRAEAFLRTLGKWARQPEDAKEGRK